MVVLLAAGRGSRMGRSDLVKVCFEIDSVPAVNRQLTVFKQQGFRRFMLVVGTMSEQVMRTVDREHPGVLYAYQQQPLGTGHAARVAAETLQNLDFQGHVLITAGDTYLEPEAVGTLVDGYVKQQADMALAIGSRQRAAISSVGRVLVGDDGQVLAIVETVDLARQAIVDTLAQRLAQHDSITAADLRTIIASHLPEGKKRQTAVAELLSLADRDEPVDPAALADVIGRDRYQTRIDGRTWTAEQIEQAYQGVNQSLYLFRSDVFFQGVGLIDNNNAQGEYYLTDVVRHLAQMRDAQGERLYRVRGVPIEHPEWIQGFNSPDELLGIQDYVRRKKLACRVSDQTVGTPRLKPQQYAPVRQWLAKLDGGHGAMNDWLQQIYGKHGAVISGKLTDLKRVLECYAARFGADDSVCIVRAPGRINLMGRHVDHRGGMTNFLAIDRETIAVAGLRDDNRVVAVNTDPDKFAQVDFCIQELIGRFAWSDWLDFVDSNWVRNMLHAAPGDWGHYIKAAMLRLQHRYQDVKIRGLNLALCGNVPIAAGLSSSSTIVVATLQAAIALNAFELTSQQFIDLCGEGEWFVGSRGGAGDHAAIYLGQRGKIAHVGYHPFRVDRIIDAPDDFQVIIANSHVRAAKSSTAKDTFNARVADYNLGLALLKQRCPEISGRVEYLRDVTPDKLGCRTSDIYRMLLKVPQRMTRADFQAALTGSCRALVETNFATHREQPYYRPRGVLLYGIAEIIRSKMCVDFLETGRVETFGNLMRVSHDGDRVSRPAADGSYEDLPENCSDAYLRELIDDLDSEDPDRVLRGQLYMQPGSYACSTREIDRMVDIAAAVPGVAGAQIAGAGLGGCVMILARRDVVPAVRDALVAGYYEPADLPPDIAPCIAVEGAGLVEW
jgi:N-acetylgalactosamine kinase